MTHSILVVDDDPVVHQLLAAVLAPHNCRIQSAYDGVEGLELFQKNSFDLVVTDVRMPRMDGLELLRQIRRLRPDAKVVVMTADNTPSSVVGSVREQAFSYFSKPFSPSAVAETIEQALRTSAWQDDIEVVSATPEWLAFRVRCKPEVAARVLAFFRELKVDLPPQEREDIALALQELVANAIEHGGGSDPQKRIRVGCVRSSRAILYYVGDPGQGFSFQELPHAAVASAGNDPLEHVEVRRNAGIRPGGFGILLARHLADELIYSEKGNEVVLIKYYK